MTDELAALHCRLILENRRELEELLGRPVRRLEEYPDHPDYVDPTPEPEPVDVASRTGLFPAAVRDYLGTADGCLGSEEEFYGHRFAYTAGNLEWKADVALPFGKSVSYYWTRPDPAAYPSRPDTTPCVTVPLVAAPTAGLDAATRTRLFQATVDGGQDPAFALLADAIGDARVILRVGHEADLKGGYPWVMRDAVDGYKAAFAYVVEFMRSRCPNVAISYNVNGAAWVDSGDGTPWIKAGYPGDDLVDIIDQDLYMGRGKWTDRVIEEAAMTAEFARERGKLVGFSEVGVWARNADGSPTTVTDAIATDWLDQWWALLGGFEHLSHWIYFEGQPDCSLRRNWPATRARLRELLNGG